MKIVSGKTGTPHVTSQQFRQILEGTIGQDSYILTSGENLEPELSTNNLLKIKSGMMSHHGNVSSVELGTYDEVTIANGSQGMKRIDLIVNRYSRNEETGVEQNSWVVIQGTPVASSPAVPSYTVGNLQEGDLVDDCPVFEVHLEGINVTEVKKLLSVTENMSTLNADLADSKKWKLHTSQAGGTTFNLPNSYNELLVYTRLSAGAAGATWTATVPSRITAALYVRAGCDDDKAVWRIDQTAGTAYLITCEINGTSQINNATTYLYYR